MSAPLERAGALRAVDRLIAAYNAVLALVWTAVAVTGAPAAAGPALGYEAGPGLAILFASAHGLGVVLAPALPRLTLSRGRLLAILGEAYPLLLIPAFWLELDPLIRTLHAGTWDAAIMTLDRGIFGYHLDQVWIRTMPQRWFSEVMHFSYWIYLPLVFTPAIVMAARRDVDAFRDVTLRLLVTYLGCYLFYITFPTAGPKVFGLPFAAPASDGFFFQLVARAHENGNVYGAAFPSSHVAGAVTVAWLGWRWFPRGVAALLTIQAMGVVMSTIYTQNHYAVDSMAGVIFAVSLQTWAVPALLRIGRAPTAPALAGPVPAYLPPRVVPPGSGVAS